MMSKQTVVTRPSVTFIVGVFLLVWTVKLSWRFFTGAHMNGKTYNDSTFWRDASRSYRNRRNAYGWWKKKSRAKRIAWRHSVFWPALVIAYGFYAIGWADMIVVFMWASPFAGYYAYRRLRPIFFVQMRMITDGAPEYYWTLRPHWFRRLERLRELFGSNKTAEPPTVPVPSEYEAAVRNEIGNEYEDTPMLSLKLLLAPDQDTEGDDA